MLRNMCKSLIKQEIYQCSFIDFLKNFSENHYDINQVDNRSRTLVHIAAINGDLGVLKCLI